MLSKLAFRNAKRSIKDYVVYLITVILAFSLIFSFNLIIFSKDITELSSSMENMKLAIISVSLIVGCVILWLINYTTKFMLLRRSKEFGTYMLLGIKKKKVINLFLLENLFLGFVALLISFVIGFFLSQLMTMIIMQIFSLPYKVNTSFGSMPFLLTISFFIVIYAIVLWCAKRKLTKMKLHDLLYYDKQNEKKIYKSTKSRVITFVISLIAGISGILLFTYTMIGVVENTNQENIMIYVLFYFLLILVSIYGLSLTVSDFLTSTFLKKKNIKYQKDNLFVIRQYTSKARTMGFTMGTLSLLITLTLVLLNISNIFSGMFQIQTEDTAPYDILVYNLYSETDPEIGTKYSALKDQAIKEIKNEYQINDQHTYRSYVNRNNQIRSHITDGRVGYQPFDCYLKESDYNKLVRMRKMTPIKLKKDEFYIHSYRDVSKELETYLKTNPIITINNQELKSKGMTDYKYTTSWCRGTSYIIIVPDEVIDTSFEVLNEVTVVDTKQETSELFAKKMKKTIPTKVFVEDEEKYETLISYQYITVKGAVLNENRSMTTIMSFSLMYLAFIFIAVVGTILSIQSLSDSTKYKYRYQTLSKLGVSNQEIYRSLRKQLLLLFGFPIVYPIIISLISSISLNLLFGPFMAGNYSIIGYVILNIFLFLPIYSIYFLATYFGFKKNIED